MDQELSVLFRQWLSAFETVRAGLNNVEMAKAEDVLWQIESRIAAAPAEGFEGLAVKLGLHCFLNEHADAASAHTESAYRDLVRLTGLDPAIEIATRFENEGGVAA